VEPVSKALQRPEAGELLRDELGMGLMPAVVPDLRQLIEVSFFGGSHIHWMMLI
jgi:hypothetical protein